VALLRTAYGTHGNLGKILGTIEENGDWLTIPEVMAHWYSPFWDHKRCWVQTQWCAGETRANSLPKSLTCLCQQLVLGWVLLACSARNKKEKRKSNKGLGNKPSRLHT